MSFELFHGDCLDVLRGMPDCSVDSIVTDPPYGLSNTSPGQVADALKAWVSGDVNTVPAKRGGFMGKDWDSFVPPPAVWVECLRVLKPGGHMAVFAGSRTQDLMGLSIRLAGFEIRDTFAWITGEGFPKGQNVGAMLEKAGDAAASRFDGWSTQLKPALEPVLVARKPIAGTLSGNVSRWGTGAINTGGERVGSEVRLNPSAGNVAGGAAFNMSAKGMPQGVAPKEAVGRWPANVALDDPASAEMERQSVGASRYFHVFRYQPKARKHERPIVTREDGTEVKHPTVKPLALMSHLVRLFTPPGGVVLDPFAGSGATIEAARNSGFRPIAIEQDAEYCDLIRERMRSK